MQEHNLSIRDETIKQLIDLAVKSGKFRQSSQTKYIHLFYNTSEEEKNDSIPIVENVLFALALFHTRTSENILEAKTIIDNLLHFQCQDHNFPTYLHEYPKCNERLLGVKLLAPLYWILKIYHSVLGTDLKKRLEISLENLLAYCQTSHKEKPVPYHMLLKIAAGSYAIGHLLNNPSHKNIGSDQLAALLSQGEHYAWYSPATLADILIALQMVYPSIKNSPWQHFWFYLNETWHRLAHSYIGPGFKEYQEGNEPQTTLYDLYLGYFADSFAQRAFLNRSCHLQAALIRPTEDRLSPLDFPTHKKGITDPSWHILQHEKYGYSTIDRKEPINPSSEQGYHPLRIVWGDKNCTHTFVCQGGNSHSVQFNPITNGLEGIFTLNPTVPLEEREKNREIAFYFDFQNDATLKVNGLVSNTFQLGDILTITMPGITFEICFSLLEGTGDFFGHFMRGNRPAQLSLQGTKRFSSYDWQVILRTLRRSDHCRFKVSIRICT